MHSKIEISVNTQKFAQSSLDERFGIESGRIQVFDIFNSFHALRALKLKKSTQKLKISVNTQKFDKVYLKNVSEVKVEEFKFLIFLTHSTLYDHENIKIHSKIENFRQHSKVDLKNVSEVNVEEFKFLIFLTHSTL